MGFDAMANDAPVPAISGDLAKKKKTRANRSATLKQCKLDARREQWLSQVEKKRCLTTASSGKSPTSPPPLPHPPPPQPSLSLSPTGPGLKSTVYMSNEEERRNPTERKEIGFPIPQEEFLSRNQHRNHFRQKSISSLGSSSRSIDAEEDEDEHEDREVEKLGLHDWEALAYAFAAVTDHSYCSSRRVACPVKSTRVPTRKNDDCLHGGTVKPGSRQMVSKAWMPDDEFRPQNLPIPSKQQGLPESSEQHYAAAGSMQNGIPLTPSCPICYEDLDSTDSSFLPCNCGFRICLFCHKQIHEADGRCPGCRKQYGPLLGGEVGSRAGMPHLVFQLSRFCSMASEL